MLVAADFIRSKTPGNRGRLSLALFPGYTEAELTDFLTTLIANGYAHPTVTALPVDERDARVEAYVYWQAYDEALSIAITSNSEVRLDNVGTKKRDAKALRETLAGWIADYRRLFETGSESGKASVPGSVSVDIVPGR